MFKKIISIGKPQIKKKNILLLMGGPLRPTLPHPLELNGHWKVWTLEKKIQKSFFFLNGPAFTPPPLLMARPLREELFLRLPEVTLEI